MKTWRIDAKELSKHTPMMRAGDRVLLSGEIYTARDAAHKRMMASLKAGEALPFPLSGACIYFAGPTPAPAGLPIGSCGPTTSSRMDPYTPDLMDCGLSATIGKGARSQAVCESIKRNKGVYFCSLGGAGVLAAQCVKRCEVIAYDDLDCESIKKLTVSDFPLIVAVDCMGADLFILGRAQYARSQAI